MSTPSFHTLFSYGATRERYLLPPGAVPIHCKALEQLVRPEQLAALSTAIRQDAHLFVRGIDNNERLLSPVTRQCLWELHSGIFLRLLENISGHEQLLPDSRHHHLLMMGTHQTLSTAHWQDTHLHLPIALYLCIGLDTGNAMLVTASASSVTVAEPTLGIAYLCCSGIPR